MNLDTALADIFVPTLVIGLGGCGIEAVSQYRDIQRSETGREDWPVHGFLGIDLETGHAPLEGFEWISLDCTCDDARQVPEWLQRDLVLRMRTNETLMQRRVGRWAAWHAMPGIMQTIRNICERLTGESASRRLKSELEGRFGNIDHPRWPYRIKENDLKIILVASSSGGTGSALVRDLAVAVGSILPDAGVLLVLGVPGEDTAGTMQQQIYNTEATLREIAWWQTESGKLEFPGMEGGIRSKVPLFDAVHIIQCNAGQPTNPEALAIAIAGLVHMDQARLFDDAQVALYDAETAEHRVFCEWHLSGAGFPLLPLADAAARLAVTRTFQDWGAGFLKDSEGREIAKDAIEFANRLYQTILKQVPAADHSLITSECTIALDQGASQFCQADPATLLIQMRKCPVEKPVQLLLETVLPEHIQSQAQPLVEEALRLVAGQMVELLMQPLLESTDACKQNHARYNIPAVRKWMELLQEAVDRRMETIRSFEPDLLKIDTVTPFSAGGFSLLTQKKKRNQQAMENIWEQYRTMVVRYLASLSDQVLAEVLKKTAAWIVQDGFRILDGVQAWIQKQSLEADVDLPEESVYRHVHVTGSFERDLRLVASKIRDGFETASGASLCRWDVFGHGMHDRLVSYMRGRCESGSEGASLVQALQESAKKFVLRYAFRGLVDGKELTGKTYDSAVPETPPGLGDSRNLVRIHVGSHSAEDTVFLLPWWRWFSGWILACPYRTVSQITRFHQSWLPSHTMNERLACSGIDPESGRYAMTESTPADDFSIDELRLRKLEKIVADLQKKFEENNLQSILDNVIKDPKLTFNPGRQILERIIKELYRIHNPDSKKLEKTECLEEMITDHQFSKKIDRKIFTYIRYVKEIGNTGSHHQDNATPDTAAALHMLEQLCQIIEWYLSHRDGFATPREK